MSLANRRELLEMFVLDAIADDYESLEKIKTEVISFGARAGMTVAADEATRALVRLLEKGLAQAFRLESTQTPQSHPGIPEESLLGEYYFWTTDEGKQLQMGDYPAWPFNDKGELRSDWQVPLD